MNTIIVATDFSALAENAAHYAAAIASRYQARLVIFNAYSLPVPAANALLTADDLDDLLQSNQRRVKKLAEQIAENYAIEVLSASAYAIIPEELENLLARYRADLIVLGMEPGSLTQHLFGNTTTTVIKKLRCPILAVPDGAHFDGLKKILFACDMRHGLPPGILQRIKAIAVPLKADMEIFYVEEAAGPEFTEVYEKAAGLQGISCTYKKIRSTQVTRKIKQEILTSGADLLIMVPKAYDFWSSVIHRSKTRAMASGLTIPLLAMPV